jgi:T4 RnlA family RNA ligase
MLDIKILEQYYNEGWLIRQTHPSLPLTIWKYSKATQYESFWNETTLQCRGLVTHSETGEILARPFRKFFNIEENRHTPTQDFEVFEKMDGSLGIMFKYRGEMICATRGSFTSDQAKWMMKYAREYNYGDVIVDGFTYLFELIYPENRIFVDYGEQERMVLLAIINTENGEEVLHNDLFRGFDVVKKYDGINDYKELKSNIGNNAEGFVVRFSNGSRMKIKGEEYIRLHRILTNVSSYNIWKTLHNGEPLSTILDNVPDEFFGWVKTTETNIRSAFDKTKNFYQNEYKKYSGIENQKEFATEVLKLKGSKLNTEILFNIRSGKDIDEIIWKMVKPQYELPFKNKEE